ncbi:hypothetical protein DT23_00745 [Thioclava indica]|uniref:Uncharacterized protein n=1 Tax=Thioclava indica TaxID=1353528 RepID=A0A074KIZ8_9RHOB|nr:hypothetical protein DT23_00745 [Thioclava indica]
MRDEAAFRKMKIKVRLARLSPPQKSIIWDGEIATQPLASQCQYGAETFGIKRLSI